ncbi:MAG: hypothetical protein M3O46_06890, partial [Myxococcota bacterium]|nr:hypothetical protein [Myxococcota bacterium]
MAGGRLPVGLLLRGTTSVQRSVVRYGLTFVLTSCAHHVERPFAVFAPPPSIEVTAPSERPARD